MGRIHSRIDVLKNAIEEHCPPCNDAKAEIKSYRTSKIPCMSQAVECGGATEITDNTLEKKLIDATAPYNEKAARNAKNFAKHLLKLKASIRPIKT